MNSQVKHLEEDLAYVGYSIDVRFTAIFFVCAKVFLCCSRVLTNDRIRIVNHPK